MILVGVESHRIMAGGHMVEMQLTSIMVTASVSTFTEFISTWLGYSQGTNT